MDAFVFGASEQFPMPRTRAPAPRASLRFRLWLCLWLALSSRPVLKLCARGEKSFSRSRCQPVWAKSASFLTNKTRIDETFDFDAKSHRCALIEADELLHLHHVACTKE
jgi:hypothetical protein